MLTSALPVPERQVIGTNAQNPCGLASLPALRNHAISGRFQAYPASVLGKQMPLLSQAGLCQRVDARICVPPWPGFCYAFMCACFGYIRRTVQLNTGHIRRTYPKDTHASASLQHWRNILTLHPVQALPIRQPAVSCTIPNPVLSRLGSVLAKLVFGELPISEHQEKVQTQISRNMHLIAGLQSRTSCMTLR